MVFGGSSVSPSRKPEYQKISGLKKEAPVDYSYRVRIQFFGPGWGRAIWRAPRRRTAPGIANLFAGSMVTGTGAQETAAKHEVSTLYRCETIVFCDRFNYTVSKTLCFAVVSARFGPDGARSIRRLGYKFFRKVCK